MLFNYLGLVLFFCLIFWVTYHQKVEIKANKPINHPLWTWFFGAVIVIMWISAADPWQDFFPMLIRDWAFLMDLILEHFVFFNPILNKWRGKAFFYINSDTHGSWFDAQFIALEVKWPGAYTWVWILAAAAFVTLTIFFI